MQNDPVDRMRRVLLLVLMAGSVLLGARETGRPGSILESTTPTATAAPNAQPAGAEKRQNTDERIRRAQLQIAAAMLELRDKYPDFENFESRIAELSDVFLPGKTVSARTYLEGLYFIAKQSAAAKAIHSEAGVGARPTNGPKDR